MCLVAIMGKVSGLRTDKLSCQSLLPSLTWIQIQFISDETVFGALLFPSVASELQGAISDLIDAVHTTLHFKDQPAVSRIGSFIGPTAAKTFQLHCCPRYSFMQTESIR